MGPPKHICRPAIISRLQELKQAQPIGPTHPNPPSIVSGYDLRSALGSDSEVHRMYSC